MISGVENCQGVGGKALPAVVADQVGVLQLQVERDISWQCLCIPCSSAQGHQQVCGVDDMLSLATLSRQTWLNLSPICVSIWPTEVDVFVTTSIGSDVGIATHANAA